MPVALALREYFGPLDWEELDPYADIRALEHAEDMGALARDYDPGDDPGDDPLADARRGKVRVASSPRPPSTGPRKGKYKT